MSKTAYCRRFQNASEEMVRCPSCFEKCTLHEYVKTHAPTRHGWNLTEKCVFCMSGTQWKRGCRSYKHLVPCLKSFIEENAVRCVEDEMQHMEVEEPITPCLECTNFRSKPRQLFGRTKDRLSEYLMFYDSVFERPDQYMHLSTIEFSEQSGLGRDLYGIVQRYLKKDLKWYHLMVVHENFHNFVEAMKEIQDKIFLLPFWCLCDGLTPNRRTHRHMIIAYEPQANFKNLWTERVKYDFADGGRSKRSIFIKDAFHLIRTIQYVSQRKSSCDGTKIHDEVEEDFRYSHFYMNRPLHEHAIAYMCTMFGGGMEKLLQEQNGKKNVVGWLPRMQTIRNEQYHTKFAVPIGKTGFKFESCVLPLAKRYEPTEEETSLQLTWYGNKKLYLCVNPTLIHLSKEKWYKHQIAKGNTLWGIREELYVLVPTQQNMMNQIKVVQKEMKEREKRRWEKNYGELEEKYFALEKRLEVVQLERNELALKYQTAQAERNELIMEKKYEAAMQTIQVQAAEIVSLKLQLQENVCRK